MKIGIDARLALRKRRGMGRVLLNLLSHLAMTDKTNKYVLYLEKKDEDNVLPANDNFTKRIISHRNYPLWEQFYLPKACLKDHLDILHCPANTGPIMVPKSVNLVMTLHDVCFLKSRFQIPRSRNLYQNLGGAYRKFCVKSLRNRINHFVTVSQFSKREIQATLGIDSEMITVIPNGVDDNFFRNEEKSCKNFLTQLGINSRFIFHLGGIAPNKNTIVAIKSYQLLMKEKEYRHLDFVIVGVPPESNNQITRFVRQQALQEKVRLLPYVADKELKSIYSNAELFLFSSLYEGFGMPPLEAMACGTPVVASNLTSIPEVVGEAAILVDPKNPVEIKKAMAHILCDRQSRIKLIHAGRRRVQNFRWEEAAKSMLAVYESIYKERN